MLLVICWMKIKKQIFVRNNISLVCFEVNVLLIDVLKGDEIVKDILCNDAEFVHFHVNRRIRNQPIEYN